MKLKTLTLTVAAALYGAAMAQAAIGGAVLQAPAALPAATQAYRDNSATDCSVATTPSQ
uniref:Uncharacterized protein n=1 Tax=Rheinheimera sp. BAL341 TaxID=1708203 RepID=A0A486XUT8_9GAMM